MIPLILVLAAIAFLGVLSAAMNDTTQRANTPPEVRAIHEETYL